MGQTSIGARFLAVNPEIDQPGLAYRVDRRLISDRARSSVLVTPVDTAFSHRHLLMPREVHRDGAGDLWLIAPFVGSARGLLSVAQLAAARDGGVIGNCEAVFVGLQLLSAAAHAHSRGLTHGPLDADQVLVDPRGGLVIELYGVDRRLRDLPVASDADRAAETRSIVAIVARLATGHLTPGHGALLALPTTLREWIERGLAEPGFTAADEAGRALEPVLQTMGGGNNGGRSWLADLTGFLGWALTRR